MDKIEKFFQELKEVDVEKVNIPRHYIPGWPSDLEIEIELTPRFHWLWFGKKNVAFIELSRSGQYEFKNKFVKLNFHIDCSGRYGIKYRCIGHSFFRSRDSTDDLRKRINALYIFQSFFDVIYKKVMIQIKEDKDSNKEVIIAVNKAFKPFIPYYTADILSK